jgi:phenylalanyl-tRNA synthetase alpha chain
MEDIKKLTEEGLAKLQNANTIEELEAIRVEYLGKSGLITSQMKLLASMSPEEKKEFGSVINQAKQQLTDAIEEKKTILLEQELNKKLLEEKIDVTLPTREERQGKIHPISQAIDEVIAILGSMGFTLAEGPDIEDDFHNFTALNVPESHPARQMHDTFYLPKFEDGKTILLRTHTSPVQIRAMKSGKPPYQVISIGRTYRCDSDMTHTPMFHQVEGLYIDKNINMRHLKGCLIEFLSKFFEVDNIPIRLRPSFFPFTEPSAEVDIGCLRENGELKIGAGSDWLEVLGSGMVHPNVLRSVGVDPEEYQGFAFGAGIERLAMLKYGIPDLRTFFDSDIRWLNHYGVSPFNIPSLIGGLSK